MVLTDGEGNPVQAGYVYDSTSSAAWTDPSVWTNTSLYAISNFQPCQATALVLGPCRPLLWRACIELLISATVILGFALWWRAGPKDESCTKRWPQVGDRVKSASNQRIEHGMDDWVLERGAIARVTEVNIQGEFKLENPAGAVSAYCDRKDFVYCREDEDLSKMEGDWSYNNGANTYHIKSMKRDGISRKRRGEASSSPRRMNGSVPTSRIQTDRAREVSG
jgi:hypothetical protein